jgi:hypothetical protein
LLNQLRSFKFLNLFKGHTLDSLLNTSIQSIIITSVQSKFANYY